MTREFEPFVLEGILFEGSYTKEQILATQNFQGKSTDLHLTTYPRTGTTWTQNILIGLVYGVETLIDHEKFELRELFPYMELNYRDGVIGYELANQITRSPRMMKNHLPVHLAPKEIFTLNRKNIIVVRNPKDTALSLKKFYQTNPNLMMHLKSDKLEDFLDRFLKGNVLCGSWWEWTKNWLKHCRYFVFPYLKG